MVFPIVGGREEQGYEISNSLRFDGSSSYLYHTHESGNKDTFTFSSWIKFGDLDNDSSADVLFSVTNTGYVIIRFEDKQLDYLDYDGSDVKSVSTNRLFRDVSTWYHIVVAIDMTQSTDSNRVKLYVNGSQESSFATATYQPQNQDTVVNTAAEHRIGRESGNYFSGYMADVNFIDGTAYAASYFGETNDNGVWIPKKPDVTYGTNGYFLEFKQTGTSANASGIGADTSNQGNHHSVSGLAATDVTTDTPTNNFATLNSVAPVGSYAEGNLRYTTSTTDGEWSTSTISISTNAKWYCEVKAISKTAGAGIYYQVGVTKGNASDFTYRALYRSDGAIYVGGSNTATFSSYTDNDIISIAYDSSNRNVTFYKNGNSEGTVTAPSLPSTSDDYFFGASSLSSGNTFITEWNFGNAPFSISSGNADANGYGNFEYAVPSGYYALCTKNLAEYG